MVLWQPVVHFEELDNGRTSYYCREIFEDHDEAKSHGYDVADKMGQDLDRFVTTKRVIIDNE